MDKKFLILCLILVGFLFSSVVKAEENKYLASQVDDKFPIVALTPTPKSSSVTRPTLGPVSTLTPTNTPKVTIIPIQCTDGERECVSESQPRVCHNGYWILEAPCAYNEKCVSGKCIPRTEPSPTRTLPTATSTTVPFECYQCATQAQGDANCDTVIDLTDFAAWLSVFKGVSASKDKVDFYCTKNDTQHVIDQLDFQVWLDSFTPQF